MKDVTKSRLITLVIFIGIAAIIFFSLSQKPTQNLTDEEVAKCIGDKTTLYVRLGCSHCEAQKEIFGENVKHLKIIDCFYESAKGCEEITATPTWKIGKQKVIGEQSIEALRSLTKC